MKVRQILVAAVVFAALGVEPPTVQAKVRPGPFRFAVVTQTDHPHFALLGGKRGARKPIRREPRYI